MNKEHLPVLITLSNLYLNNGKFEQALSTIEKAISFYPESVECYELKGEILINMGKEEDSKACFKKAFIIKQIKN